MRLSSWSRKGATLDPHAALRRRSATHFQIPPPTLCAEDSEHERQLRARIVAGNGAGLVVIAGLGACAIRAGGPPGEFTYVVGSMRQNGGGPHSVSGAPRRPPPRRPPPSRLQIASRRLGPARGKSAGQPRREEQLEPADLGQRGHRGDRRGHDRAHGDRRRPRLAGHSVPGARRHHLSSCPQRGWRPCDRRRALSSVSRRAPRTLPSMTLRRAAPATIVTGGGEPTTSRTTVSAPTSWNGIGSGVGRRIGAGAANAPTTVTNPSANSAPVTSKTPASGPGLRNPAPVGALVSHPWATHPWATPAGAGNGKEAARWRAVLDSAD